MVESPNPAGTVNAAAINEETAIRVINSSDKKTPLSFHARYFQLLLNIFVGQ